MPEPGVRPGDDPGHQATIQPGTVRPASDVLEQPGSHLGREDSRVALQEALERSAPRPAFGRSACRRGRRRWPGSWRPSPGRDTQRRQLGGVGIKALEEHPRQQVTEGVDLQHGVPSEARRDDHVDASIKALRHDPGGPLAERRSSSHASGVMRARTSPGSARRFPRWRFVIGPRPTRATACIARPPMTTTRRSNTPPARLALGTHCSACARSRQSASITTEISRSSVNRRTALVL